MCDTKAQISNKNSISNEISTVNSLNDNPCPTNQYPTKTSSVPLHEHYVSSFFVTKYMRIYRSYFDVKKYFVYDFDWYFLIIQ